MRSRYCAYYLHNADYIIKTTHRQNIDYSDDKQQWKNDILEFVQNYTFEKLIIEDFIEDSPTSYVTFTAYISLNGEDNSFTEKSSFEKINNAWMYLKAEELKDK